MPQTPCVWYTTTQRSALYDSRNVDGLASAETWMGLRPLPLSDIPYREVGNPTAAIQRTDCHGAQNHASGFAASEREIAHLRQ